MAQNSRVAKVRSNSAKQAAQLKRVPYTHGYTSYAVFGRNGFPIDVLRQQRAYAASMLDSNEIAESHKGPRKAPEIPYLVRLVGLDPPDGELWHKYGWTVATPEEALTYDRLRR